MMRRPVPPPPAPAETLPIARDQWPRILTRTYRGKPEEATRLYNADAAQLAPMGYVPISQQYVPGTWTCGQFLLALVLAFVLVGILIFIYMLLVKPAGVLTVTYELRG